MSRTSENRIRSRSRRISLFLVLLDLTGLVAFYSIAHWLRLNSWIALDSAQLWVLIFVGMLVMYIMDVYRTEDPGTKSRLPLNTFIACIVAMFASMVFVYTIGVDSFTPVFGRGVLPAAMLAFSVWAPLWRWLLTHWQKRMTDVLDWLVVVDKETFELFSVDCAQEFPNMKIHWVDSSVDKINFKSLELRENQQGLPSCAVIFSSHAQVSRDLAQQLLDIRFSGFPVLTLTEFYEQYLLKVPVVHLKAGWFVHARGFNLVHDHIGLRIKRLLDVVFATIGGLLTLPVCMLLALFIRLDSKGAAIFRQERIGLYGKPFVLYKLRTMVMDAETEGAQWSTPGDQRITRLGRLLRKSRLDELPQLWNLFKGEMSLIGPRPERPEFTRQLEEDIPYYDLRHLVPPGITGWAQVMYPYASSIDDAQKKLEYDLFYIKNHSLQLDLAIVFKTVLVMLANKGR